MKKNLFMALATGLFAVALSSASHAAPLIDTTSSWNGSSFVFPMGETNTATYGQTFTVTGSETVLNNFTFFLNDSLNPDYVDFAAYVYAWDGNMATGSTLFQSGPMSTTNNGGRGGFEAITINTGGIDLTSGSQYVAFFSSSNYFDGIYGTSDWGLVGNSYSGGQFVYMNNGSNFGMLTAPYWVKDYSVAGSDLAFTMNFSEAAAPVPEPSTMLLLGSGLLGLVGLNRRRKA